jgi:hypothetical protein
MADESEKTDTAPSLIMADSEIPQYAPVSSRKSTPVSATTSKFEAAASKERAATDAEGPATQRTHDKENRHGKGTSQVIQPVVTFKALQENTIKEEEQKTASLFGRPDISESEVVKEEQMPTLPPVSSVLSNVVETTTATPSRSLDHLEAYILLHHTESLGNITIWSTKTQLLYLDEAAMWAHLNKLRPNCSVIDTMVELLPEQLRLIQERTKSRNGRLVFVQQGASVDMVTQIGTFKIKSVLFFINIATKPEKKDSAEKNEFTFAKARLQVKKQIPHPGSSLFGRDFALPGWIPPNNSNVFSGAPVKSEASLVSHFSSPQSPKLEPMSTANPFQTNGPISATSFGASPQPTTQSQAKDPFIPLEEQDGVGNAKSKHMTINLKIPYQNTSLEELRVTDYAIGRMEPTKVPKVLHTVTGVGKRMFSDDKPFGGQDFHYNVASPSYPATGGLFGGSTGGQLGSTSSG